MQTHQGSLMLAQCQALCCEGESAVSRTGSLPLKSNLEGRQPTSPVVWADSVCSGLPCLGLMQSSHQPCQVTEAEDHHPLIRY